MVTDQPALPVLVLVRDLMFAARVRAAAESLAAPVQMLRDASQLNDHGGRRLIVDLGQAGFREAAAEWKRRTGGEVVGFIAHVDAPGIAAAAREMGFQVLARSRFVEVLPDLLR